ncbi:hypothetical protein AUR04nite_11140 [Glutamicibacter uratoxydans]|uniref:Uncharacterized protein n=1 Tax=Glutamicibacter uratoxydans TaxID=43667 RepID=A0A4Y4DJW5_GLUUR|nr:hypothetical protein [Glutamicibacter uratoxydans]GED05582.1 hypothetical protein AUR04nite_11140 [Glutamicibacter uratoxydans]
MSASSLTLSIVSRVAIVIAVLSALSLVATLVLYFQQIAIPRAVMALGVWGLPVAFLLAAVVVIGNIIKRRNT